MTTVAVTGVTGCIGAAVVSAFAHRGWNVRGLVRPERPSSLDSGVDVHVGDVTRPSSLRGLCSGADVVVHAAALVSDWDDPGAFARINRDGTRAVLEEARASGVRRFVYLSTADVFGFDSDHLIDERSPKRCPPYPYSRSKLAGEELARRYACDSLEVSVVYPTWVFGPGDRHLVPELIDGLRTRQLVYFDRGATPLELTYSENLAAAIALVATTNEAAGEAYIVGDGYGLTLGGFIDDLAAATGVQPPRFSVPLRVALLAAAASEAAARVGSRVKRPLLTRYAVRSAGSGMRYDLAKIQLLGYQPAVGREEALRRTIAPLDASPRQLTAERR